MVERSHTANWWPSVYEPFRKVGERVADWFAPKSDAAVSKENYRVRVELPGVDVEDIDISVHDNTLVIQGEKRTEREETGESYFFSEREYGAFLRSFRLPADADASAVDADFKNGVLTVTVPKVGKEPERVTKIAIRTE